MNHAAELAKCSVDAAYFTHHFLEIDDAQGHGDGGGTMPFHLWPAQAGVLWQLQSERLVLILKARQLGISWICCAYALQRVLFNAGQVVLLYSKGQAEANELLRRIKALYERLPAWMQAALPTIVRDNTEEIQFSNGSRVRSLPATQNAGRSLTASLVILDEAAFLQWADPLFTALKPTIDGGGQLIILSTANGIGNLYHRLWTKAEAKENFFRAIFLPWHARPGRDAAWYAQQLKDYDDPQKVKQEYPSTAREAFLVSGRVRFKAEWIEAQEQHRLSGITLNSLPDLAHIPGLTVYTRPDAVKGKRLILGGDVAEGLEGGDYSCATLLDAVTWEEIAHLHGHFEPDEFARHLDTLGRAYDAEIAVERNNHGHAVLSTLKALNNPRIADGLDGRPGWHTNAQTKPMMIDKLAEALRDTLIKLRTAATHAELQIYRINPNGSTGAPPSYNDDRVMSAAIALIMAAQPPNIAKGHKLGLWARKRL